MRKFVSLVLSLLFALGITAALAEGSAAQAVSAMNPENYPYFYVMGISTVETQTSPVIVVKGCFGDFLLNEDDGEADLDVFGFDEENPVELKLSDDCAVLMPMDFDENIVLNLPCQDILQWFAAQNEGKEEPYTFYAVLTLDQTNQVTKLEYQYFPWG